MRYVLLLATLLFVGCGQPIYPPPENATPTKLVAFTATWCGACQQDKDEIEQVRASGIWIQVVDVDKQPDLADRYGVTELPTYFACTAKGCLRTNDIEKARAWLLGTNEGAEGVLKDAIKDRLPKLSLKQKLKLNLLKLLIKRRLREFGDGAYSALKPALECCTATPSLCRAATSVAFQK